MGPPRPAISADVDSFREDDIARGPADPQRLVAENSLNGILVRAQLSGRRPADQRRHLPRQPDSTAGGVAATSRLDDPLPYILTSPDRCSASSSPEHRAADQFNPRPALHPARG